MSKKIWTGGGIADVFDMNEVDKVIRIKIEVGNSNYIYLESLVFGEKYETGFVTEEYFYILEKEGLSREDFKEIFIKDIINK